MRVAGYLAIHYGKDYLAYAIRSMYSVCDRIYVLYSPSASHGKGTNLECPDTKEELLRICDQEDKEGKIFWYENKWRAENDQRNYAHHLARSEDFDILVCTDADEVWKTEILKALVKQTYERKASKCLVWMRHLWRSFNYICDDPMRQERIYYMGKDAGDLIYAEQPENHVWHFGYARKFKEIEYKISIHGHSAEWTQPKEQWFTTRYMPFPPVPDTHPTCKGYWNPAPFDKNELPEMMKDHPYYNLESIE